MSSYGGNAGKRSMPPGPPPDFPGMTRDGIFFIDSSVRLSHVTDGSSNTLLFGERFHHDPEFDFLQPDVLPGVAPMAALGKWGFVAGAGGAMANVTLHTAGEDQLPGAARGRSSCDGRSDLRLRQRPPGRRQLRLRGWLGALRR